MSASARARAVRAYVDAYEGFRKGPYGSQPRLLSRIERPDLYVSQDDYEEIMEELDPSERFTLGQLKEDNLVIIFSIIPYKVEWFVVSWRVS